MTRQGSTSGRTNPIHVHNHHAEAQSVETTLSHAGTTGTQQTTHVSLEGPPFGNHAGFALVQVLLAVALLAILSVFGWMTVQRLSTTKKTIETFTDQAAQGRMALERLARDLSMAYLSVHYAPGKEATPRTFFVGTHPSSGLDDIRFTYFGHQASPAHAEGDTAAVAYVPEADATDQSVMNLVRYETQRIQPIDPSKMEQGAQNQQIVCTHVKQFEVWYYNPTRNEWVPNWQTLQDISGYPRRLPSRIRIKLGIQTEKMVLYFVTETQPALFQVVDNAPK